MPLSPSRSRGRAIGWLCIKSKIRRLNNSRHRVQIALLQTETSFIFNRSVISPLNEARRSKNSVSLPLPSLPWRSKLYRPVPIENFPTRSNPFTHNPQILTTDVLRFLKARIPADAFCVLAITMEDLYPEPSWNFVFGQASIRDRVGVYSFARYDPAFYGEARTSGYEVLLFRRSCKVLAHETSHMFGLTHCTFFNCLMNGSNHLAESDRRPLHLCPVCLRKLQWSVGFDVLARYTALERFNRSAGFTDEAEWLKARIQEIRQE